MGQYLNYDLPYIYSIKIHIVVQYTFPMTHFYALTIVQYAFIMRYCVFTIAY